MTRARLDRWWDHTSPDLTPANLIVALARATRGDRDPLPGYQGYRYQPTRADYQWIESLGLADRFATVTGEHVELDGRVYVGNGMIVEADGECASRE